MSGSGCGGCNFAVSETTHKNYTEMETDEKEKNEQVADSPEAAATEESGRPVTSFEFLAGAAYDFWEDF